MKRNAKGWAKANIPILDWLPKYERSHLKLDIVAGITAGMVVIPAALGWASVAGVPAVYGLYAAMVSLIAYFIFGTSRHLMVVPSSGPAALVGAGLAGLVFADQNEYIAAVAMLAFLAGLLLLVARLIKLGFIVNFISQTVLLGFQVGLAIFIITTQIGRVLGISGGSGNFADLISYYIQHISEASLATMALAAVGFAFLYLGKRYFKKLPLKFVLILLATIAAILLPFVENGIAVVGEIPDGLPSLVLPSMGGQSLESLMYIAVGLFLIIYIEGISISKSFARKGGYEVDTNQEFVAYGTANIIPSFFQGMPLNGSVSNTAINYESGGKTQLSGGFAAIVIILVLLFFASFFSNLPSAIIGVVIIASMVSLIDIKALRAVLAFDRLEFVFAVAAMLGVLFIGLLQGIFIGVALTLIALLYRFSKPGIKQLGRIPGSTEYTDLDRRPDNETLPGVLVLRIDGPMIFPNLARARQDILGFVRKSGKPELVVLSMRSAPYMDLQATDMLSTLHDELRGLGTSLKLAEATGDCRDSIKKAGLDSKFGELNPGMSVQMVIDDWLKGRKE
jgi:high affinity sulfate transporter 1